MGHPALRSNRSPQLKFPYFRRRAASIHHILRPKKTSLTFCVLANGRSEHQLSIRLAVIILVSCRVRTVAVSSRSEVSSLSIWSPLRIGVRAKRRTDCANRGWGSRPKEHDVLGQQRRRQWKYTVPARKRFVDSSRPTIDRQSNQRYRRTSGSATPFDFDPDA